MRCRVGLAPPLWGVLQHTALVAKLPVRIQHAVAVVLELRLRMSLVIKVYPHRILHDVAVLLIECIPAAFDLFDINMIFAGGQASLSAFAIDVEQAGHPASGIAFHGLAADVRGHEPDDILSLPGSTLHCSIPLKVCIY